MDMGSISSKDNMKISKDNLEVTVDELLDLLRNVPDPLRTWVFDSMQKILQVEFRTKKEGMKLKLTWYNKIGLLFTYTILIMYFTLKLLLPYAVNRGYKDGILKGYMEGYIQGYYNRGNPLMMEPENEKGMKI